MKIVDAMGDACPIPVVKTKKAIEALETSDIVQTLVDNEIAVQNLTKMAQQKNFPVQSEKLGEGEYKVTITVDDPAAAKGAGPDGNEGQEYACPVPSAGRKVNTVVAVTSPFMGTGDDKLGAMLIKGFFFALTQQDELPDSILFYNGGVKLSTEGADPDILSDIRKMEEQGVQILSCGTCLNFYGLSEKLAVGSVTNMYEIVEKLSKAGRIIRP